MIVGVSDNVDPVAHIEGIMQDPFEGAPGRMNLNRTFDDAIMGLTFMISIFLSLRLQNRAQAAF